MLCLTAYQAKHRISYCLIRRLYTQIYYILFFAAIYTTHPYIVHNMDNLNSILFYLNLPHYDVYVAPQFASYFLYNEREINEYDTQPQIIH